MPVDKKPLNDRDARLQKATKNAKNSQTEKDEKTKTNMAYMKILELCNEDKKKSRFLKDPQKMLKAELKDKEQVVEMDENEGDDE